MAHSSATLFALHSEEEKLITIALPPMRWCMVDGASPSSVSHKLIIYVRVAVIQNSGSIFLAKLLPALMMIINLRVNNF